MTGLRQLAHDLQHGGAMPSVANHPSPICDVIITRGGEAESLNRALAAARQALASRSPDLSSAMHALSGEVARLPRRLAQDPVIADLRAFLHDVTVAGVQPELVAAAGMPPAQGSTWTHLLATMLVTTPSRWTGAPRLADVPDFLWGDYIAWLFSAQSVEDSVSVLLRHLEDLHHWVTRNYGSSAVRAAAEAWLKTGAVSLGGGTPTQRRRAAELRGLLLTRLIALKDDSYVELPPLERLGRRLRVGFVTERLGVDARTAQLLAQFEQLDTTQFEVEIFVLQESYSRVEEHARSRATQLTRLASELAAQLDTLRAAQLDVLVFGDDLSASVGPLQRLALHRVAAIQVAGPATTRSTGLPTIDLQIASAAVDAAAFTERVVLAPGPQYTLALLGDTEPGEMTREALGLPSDATLLTTIANRKTTAPTLETWARLLAAAPTTRMVVAFAGENADEFCQRFSPSLESHKVPIDRVAVFPANLEAPSEMRDLLRVSDFYLDVDSAADPIWIAEAFKLGRPALTPQRSPLVDALGVPELALAAIDQLIDCVQHLAEQPDVRSALAERVGELTAQDTAGCFDSLAASDRFAAAIETAYDEACTAGLEAFRTSRTAIVTTSATTIEVSIQAAQNALEQGDSYSSSHETLQGLRIDPLNTTVRALRGRALLLEGRSAPAVSYLLAVVQQEPENAAHWFTLASALRADGKVADALQALETSLRINHLNPEGWMMMIEVADAAGAYEIAKDAFEALKLIAPDHPRAADLALRLGL
jgi:protein O-GlcNAc transferase